MAKVLKSPPFDEWIRHLFDRPVSTPAWYWDADADSAELQPQEVVAYTTRLFQQGGALLAPYDNAQVNQGLNFLIDECTSDLYALTDNAYQSPIGFTASIRLLLSLNNASRPDAPPSFHARTKRDRFRLDRGLSGEHGRGMPERIQRLKEAVEHAHACRAVHCGSEHIRETFNGRTVWEGLVECFDLMNHPKAARCYAWSYEVGAETHYTTVLDLPPVTSARSAVQVAIAATARR